MTQDLKSNNDDSNPKFLLKFSNLDFSNLDEKKIESLQQKQVYFARPTQLNDPHEERFSYIPNEKEENEIEEMVNKYFSNNKEVSQIVADEQLTISKHFKDHFEIKNWPLTSKLSAIVNYNVGILSLSCANAFSDVRVNLMLAYYANSYKGVVLVYESTVGVEEVLCQDKVNCESTVPYASSHKSGVTFFDDKGNFKIKDFVQTDNFKNIFFKKDKIWAHEKEYRLISAPGPKLAESCGLKLRGIFYTSRISQKNLNVLKTINQSYYGNSLFIEEIAPCYGRLENVEGKIWQVVQGRKILRRKRGSCREKERFHWGNRIFKQEVIECLKGKILRLVQGRKSTEVMEYLKNLDNKKFSIKNPKKRYILS